MNSPKYLPHVAVPRPNQIRSLDALDKTDCICLSLAFLFCVNDWAGMARGRCGAFRSPAGPVPERCLIPFVFFAPLHDVFDQDDCADWSDSDDEEFEDADDGGESD